MSIQHDTGGASIKNLPLNDPRCSNDSCIAFQAAHNLSQKEVSYTLQYQYGHWMAWYYAIFIFLATLVYFSHQYIDSRPSAGSRSRTSQWQKFQACRRYIAYRRVHGSVGNKLGLPSAGLLIFLLVGVAVVSIMTFAIRPYYRQHRGYGSPPLAVRTGLMAASLTPLLVALSGKVNLVTMLTGYGYEKLNVIHRWVGWATFALSVVHTIPFIVAPLNDGGYAALHKQFYKPGAFEYTGVPPLAILFGIVVCSLPTVRHRLYESFYWSHFVLAVTYLGLCFWHFDNEGDSWSYLWATMAIWLFSILGRIFTKNQSFKVSKAWPTEFPACLLSLPGGMTRIDVLVPLSLSWKPGQHCYVRLPLLSPFDNHPFTIASASSTRRGKMSNEGDDLKRMSFFVRTHSGFTRKLETWARSDVDICTSAWLDGPYGGVSRINEKRYETMILIAGGSGITACLSWLLYCAQKMHDGIGDMSKIKLIWMVQDRVQTEWVADEIKAAKILVGGDRIEINVYITRTEGQNRHVAGAESNKDKEESIQSVVSTSSQTSTTLGTFHSGRPFIPDVLPAMLSSGRNIVIGCGPESLKIDIANASAAMQLQVLKGEAAEVALHTETFGWG